MATTDRGEFLKLVGKYLDGTASVEEIAVLDAYYEIFAEAPDALEGLNEKNLMALEIKMKSGVSRRIKFGEVGKVLPIAAVTRGAVTERPVVPLYRRWKYASIAAVLALAVTVFYYSNRNSDSGIKNNSIAGVNDIAPGKNGATLKLDNGEVIELSDAKKGVMVKGEHLTYDDGSNIGGFSANEAQRIGFVMAETKRGQTYEFTLPDGTHVWLNAASQISFPTQFSGQERKVVLKGEGYFEVAKDKLHPFIVLTDKQSVEVLGTHFNISAYAEERDTRTTLLEGSVKVSSLASFSMVGEEGKYPEVSTIIKPNQQALLSDQKQLVVKEVSTDEVVAWKEGLFAYNSTTLEEVMRQASRWYDVKVIYEDESLKQKKLSGAVTRYDNISSLLKAISYTAGIKFTIEGRNLLIKK